MLNVLVMVNYQREIPPFMITQIHYAKQVFDEVLYVTPKLYNDNSKTVLDKNVKVEQIPNNRKFLSALKLPLMFFRAEVRKDICKAIKTKRFNKAFIEHLLSTLIPADVLFRQLTKVARRYTDCKVYMLASWFNCNAYAVARLKLNNPNIIGASLAHAFEVNPERSNLIDLSLNEYKHAHLDRVSFISRNVLRKYLSVVSRTVVVPQNNLDVYYLGCTNNGKPSSEFKHGYDTLEILTCSTVNSIKRLELIFEALEKWNFCKLHWTHIGNGPLFEVYSQKANEISSTNELLTISFIGGKTNAEVHQYYAQHCFDLFLNVSSSEGLPVSLMEAISYGIPIVATNVGGSSEIANENTGFLLMKHPSPNEISSVLKQYASLPEEEKNNYRMNARKFWEENFNAEKNVIEYYNSLLTLCGSAD